MKKFLAVMMFALMIATQARAAEFEMVEYSAQVKLQWLAAAGIPEAQKFLKLIDRPVFFNADNLQDFKRLELTNSLYQELNMQAAMEFVRENNYKNVMDLACSLSPRAMILGDEGRKVAVGELQTVCLIGDWCLEEFGSKKKAIKNVWYDAYWLQDKAGMMASADKLKGEVCIIEQGVMIYLADDVRAQMYENLRDVLKKHGGCLITSDFCQKKYFTDTAAALFGEQNAPTLYDETKAMYEKVFGDKIADDLQDEQEAMEFLKTHGLTARKVPLFSKPPTLHISGKLTPAQLQAVNELTRKDYLWVITAL